MLLGQGHRTQQNQIKIPLPVELLQIMYSKDNLREQFAAFIDPLIMLLERHGLKPTHITLMGLVFTTAACYTYYVNQNVATFVLMTLGRFCDAVDGAFARQTNQVTQFGGFLDSLIDRYCEFIIAGTILFVYREDIYLYYLSFILFLGLSLMPYSRALYDKYGVQCPANPFEYFERGILLVTFFLLGRLDLWVVVVALGTNIFVILRLRHFWKVTREAL